jgi:glycosyltransferase involved in cell wall biosynthesis
MSEKVAYIVSNIQKSLAFEWIATQLNKEKFDLSFILLNDNDSDLEQFLKLHHIPVCRVLYRGKKDILRALFQIRSILAKNKINIVHTHLFEASLIGLTAAQLAGVKKRIHTRHSSSYHHVYFPHMVKYDKYINARSTDIVAISENVKKILIENENVPAKKIHLIYHGFDLNSFRNVSKEEIDQLKTKYNPVNNAPVIGVISRYTEWKGIQYIIGAFKKLLLHYPDALLLLSNANGNYKKEIKELLKDLPKRNYNEIVFENNIFALYHLFDIFVHVPIDDSVEAFGQIYVEALASGIPSVFTLSGIATEFIEDKKNALVVPYKNADAIYEAMLSILQNKVLAQRITTNGKKDVEEQFGLENFIASLEALYAK